MKYGKKNTQQVASPMRKFHESSVVQTTATMLVSPEAACKTVGNGGSR
jgi:hypothetical protein